MKPTRERAAELLEIITEGIRGNRELSEYHDWDDLIEVDEELTFEEWEWCRDNMKVEVSVSVSVTGLEEGS